MSQAKRAGLTLLCTAILPVAASSQQVDVAQLAWMAGCWQSTAGSTVVEETWMAPAGGLMLGMSRTVRDGIARGYEFVTLGVDGGKLVYTARPSGQQPAAFVASIVLPNRVSFQNPSHDFPRRIDYELASNDSLVASVYATIDSPDPAFELHYGKQACP